MPKCLILLFLLALTATACSSAADTASSSPAPPTPEPSSSTPPPLGELTGAVAGTGIDKAATNSVFACDNFPKVLQPATSPWTNNQTGVITLEEAPRVPGDVEWNSQFATSTDGESRTVSGNQLPDHGTGIFPIPTDSTAYEYDRNPSTIKGRSLTLELPAKPDKADEPTCVGGGAIGIMVTGAVLFNALDIDGIVAVGQHAVDRCYGHAAPSGEYHYHSDSTCFPTGNPDEHSPLIGYALDGFGIYGPLDEGGETIKNSDLDKCHGHDGPVKDEDGNAITTYHYHLNNEFPFVPGCFRGTPVSVAPARGPAPVAFTHPDHH